MTRSVPRHTQHTTPSTHRPPLQRTSRTDTDRTPSTLTLLALLENSAPSPFICTQDIFLASLEELAYALAGLEQGAVSDDPLGALRQLLQAGSDGSGGIGGEKSERGVFKSTFLHLWRCVLCWKEVGGGDRGSAILYVHVLRALD